MSMIHPSKGIYMGEKRYGNMYDAEDDVWERGWKERWPEFPPTPDGPAEPEIRHAHSVLHQSTSAAPLPLPTCMSVFIVWMILFYLLGEVIAWEENLTEVLGSKRLKAEVKVFSRVDFRVHETWQVAKPCGDESH